MIIDALTAFTTLTLVSILHTLLGALIAWQSGTRVLEIALGTGPTLSAIKPRGIRCSLRLIPFGGSVTMHDTNAQAEQGKVSDTGMADAFNHRPLWIRLIISLGPSLVLLGLGILILGPPGLDAFVTGFAQIIRGALSPLVTANLLIQNFVDFMNARGYLTAVGLAAAKFAALSLIPLPGSNAGMALIMLMRGKRTTPVRAEELFISIFMLPMLALWLSWAIALVYYLWTVIGG